MPKLYPAQPVGPMLQIPKPQQSNPLGGKPTMQNMGNEPPQGFLGSPQQKPQVPKQSLTPSKPQPNQGWIMGVSLAQQQATDPLMKRQLSIQNSVTAPKQANQLRTTVDILSKFVQPFIPKSIKTALGM